MTVPDPRLAYAYRVLADTAIVVGAVSLILALTLPTLAGSNGWPLIATAVIAGVVTIAAAIQHRRYQHHRW